MVKSLYYRDNLEVLRNEIKDESVDLIYLDPPFNSNVNYNVLAPNFLQQHINDKHTFRSIEPIDVNETLLGDRNTNVSWKNWHCGFNRVVERNYQPEPNIPTLGLWH
jgi:16S rRNA G966 N2-methylase RsmD